MNNEIKIKNKSLLMIFTIILGLGITFGTVYYIYYMKDVRENTINTGLVTLNFTEGAENINITVLPALDEVGLQNTPYSFTMTNTSSLPIDAKISLDLINSTINLRAVKYGLYINNELVKKDYLNPDDLTLYTYENMSVNETLNCKIVFWIDYYYTNSQSNETFVTKIKVDGMNRDNIVR